MGAAYPPDTPPPTAPVTPPPGGPFPPAPFDDDGNPLGEPLPVEPTDLAPEEVARLRAGVPFTDRRDVS